ncbi:sensor histidine kinase [Luteococcus sp.]|uniref:sensor histidine kinase n=1 Tax=Luteococcus sp. TaxID=1969402 RepID=UPI0037355361
MTTTARSARRLSTMVRHSSHLFFGLLWVVAMATHLRRHDGPAATLLGGALLVTYLGGLLVQSRRPDHARRPLLGRLWVLALALLWAAASAVSGAWVWLVFPIFFLVLFIWPSPTCWLLLAGLTLWAGLSPLTRGEGLAVGKLLGPALGAGAAVIAWTIGRQLHRDALAQQQLAEQVLQAQDELLATEKARARAVEREGLARDLHDTLAQGLNSIVMLSRSAAAEHPEAGGQLAVIEQTARENLVQARQLVHRLTREESRDLREALTELVEATARRERAIGSGLEVRLSVSGDEGPVGPEVQQVVVMATRSLLANVVQHAQARTCVVSLAWFDDALALDVVDNGVGLATDHADRFGLSALRSRVETVRGTISVESEPGGGTCVGLHLPLSRPAHGKEL